MTHTIRISTLKMCYEHIFVSFSGQSNDLVDIEVQNEFFIGNEGGGSFHNKQNISCKSININTNNYIYSQSLNPSTQYF
jgi:hypothetical protein